jgi:hypothetical protein
MENLGDSIYGTLPTTLEDVQQDRDDEKAADGFEVMQAGYLIYKLKKTRRLDQYIKPYLLKVLQSEQIDIHKLLQEGKELKEWSTLVNDEESEDDDDLADDEDLAEEALELAAGQWGQELNVMLIEVLISQAHERADNDYEELQKLQAERRCIPCAALVRYYIMLADRLKCAHRLEKTMAVRSGSYLEPIKKTLTDDPKLVAALEVALTSHPQFPDESESEERKSNAEYLHSYFVGLYTCVYFISMYKD